MPWNERDCSRTPTTRDGSSSTNSSDRVGRRYRHPRIVRSGSGCPRRAKPPRAAGSRASALSRGRPVCGRCRGDGRTSRFIYTEARGRNGKRYSYFLCRGRQEGVCDLPHLPADRVEDAIVEHYGTLRIPEGFQTTARELLGQVMTDEQASVRQMHSSMTKQLKDLDAKEERLLDLAADGTLPQTKIKDRLRKIHADRAAVEAGLTATNAELAVGWRSSNEGSTSWPIRGICTEPAPMRSDATSTGRSSNASTSTSTGSSPTSCSNHSPTFILWPEPG